MPGIYEYKYQRYVREETVLRRHEQLIPALSRLAANAILAYDDLRLTAKPGEEATEDEPVVMHDFELGGKTVGRYVKARLGEHHRLDLYDNRKPTGILTYAWQFSRTQPVERLMTQTTTVTKFSTSSTPDGEELIDISANSHIYQREIGQRMRYGASLCGPAELYRDAEQYINDFEADIEQAVSELGT